MSQKITKATRTVSVASRLDHDVIIHVDQKKPVRVTGQYGSTTEDIYTPGHGAIIFGKQRPRGEIPEGYTLPEQINGCAITRNVDAELWEAWVKQVLEGPGIGDAVRNGTLSAYA